MTDEELVALNREGFIPGPDEGVHEFLERVREFGRETVKLGGDPIPDAHWQWVRGHLKKVFDFEPASLPAFYSNRLLAPWQGAAAWILNGRLIGIQLRERMRTGSYLGLYQRDEILAHEAVHAARSAFHESENEEFFAYLTSEAKWRRALGPILRRPWEAWPFVIGLGVGIFWPWGWWVAASWFTLGSLRLVRQHRILAHATRHILDEIGDTRTTRAILLRLTDREIRHFAKLGNIRNYAEKEPSLRWRLIRLAYIHGTKNSRSGK